LAGYTGERRVEEIESIRSRQLDGEGTEGPEWLFSVSIIKSGTGGAPYMEWKKIWTCADNLQSLGDGVGVN
jgi:hypothetical protein